jgi:1-acyl-sn-glycerol-3-phosphate acyltransferase
MKRSAVRIARSTLAAGFFAFYGLFGLLALPAVLPLVFFQPAVRWLVRRFYRLFVFFADITGLFGVECGSLSGIRGKIVVINHITLIDVVILMALLPDSSCVVKESVARNPFFMAAVRAMFIVNRGDSAATMASAKKLLDKGVNIVIFPEGTRNAPHAKNVKLHRGAARMAMESGADIVALHIESDPQVLGKHQPFWEVGERKIRFTIENRGVIAIPPGESTRAKAVELTEKIGEAIL